MMQRLALVTVAAAAVTDEPQGIIFDNATDLAIQLERNAQFEKDFLDAPVDNFEVDRNGMAHCGQYCDEWCWATSATMVASTFGGGSNCAANEAKIASQEWGRQCDTSCSSQCNKGGSPQNIIHGISLLSGKSYQSGGVLSQSQLNSALQGGPVVVLVKWNGGGGHAVTIESVSGGTYRGYNPWPPTQGTSINVQYSGITNFQGKGRWAGSVYTNGGGPSPGPSPGPGPSPSGCQDLQGWVTSEGEGCYEYGAYNYCTSNGRPGRGWKSSWGSLSQWTDSRGRSSLQACCACGGGSRAEDVIV